MNTNDTIDSSNSSNSSNTNNTLNKKGNINSTIQYNENIEQIILKLQLQIINITKTQGLRNDFTLLDGILIFTHSKLNILIDDILNNLNVNSSEDVLLVNLKQLVTILNQSWEKLWYPIFKWFQMWRKSIVVNNIDKQKNEYSEFRKMNKNLNKFSNSINDFYRKIIIQINGKFDIANLISDKLILTKLNIDNKKGMNDSVEIGGEKIKLNKDSMINSYILLIFNRCIVYLGSIQKYKISCSKINNFFSIKDFSKVIEFFDIAIKLIPSLGETFFQMGLLYTQCNNFGLATYDFIRGATTINPDNRAILSFKTLFFNPQASISNKIKELVISICADDLDNNKIVNREIIEYYFLAVLGSKISPQIWLDSYNKSFLQNTRINISKLELKLFDKISNRFLKNIQTILKNLLVLIGTFHLLLVSANDNADSKITELKQLNESELKVLNFTFKYINNILQNVIIKAWRKNSDSFEYLAMVRIILFWLQTDSIALEFAKDNQYLAKNLTLLINDIVKSKLTTNNIINNEDILLPRDHLFEEEILLNGFMPILIKFSGLNDQSIFQNDNLANILASHPDASKEENEQKFELRLESVIILSKSLLKEFNKKIEIDMETGLYLVPEVLINSSNMRQMKKKIITLTKNDENSNKPGMFQIDSKKKITSKEETGKVFTMQNLEKQMKNDQKNNTVWGYSGSNAPTAPSVINIKPSDDMIINMGKNSKTFKENVANTVKPNFPEKEGAVITTENTDSSNFYLSSIENSINELMQTSHSKENLAGSTAETTVNSHENANNGGSNNNTITGIKPRLNLSNRDYNHLQNQNQVFPTRLPPGIVPPNALTSPLENELDDENMFNNSNISLPDMYYNQPYMMMPLQQQYPNFNMSYSVEPTTTMQKENVNTTTNLNMNNMNSASNINTMNNINNFSGINNMHGIHNMTNPNNYVTQNITAMNNSASNNNNTNHSGGNQSTNGNVPNNYSYPVQQIPHMNINMFWNQNATNDASNTSNSNNKNNYPYGS